MELIIKIDEQTYDDVKKEYEALGDYEVIGEFEYAIANGISLDSVKPEIERAIGDFPTSVIYSIFYKHLKENENDNI